MKLTTVLTPEAEDDLDAAFAWYEEQRPGLGVEFLNTVEQQLDRILEHPKLYQQVEQTVRRAILHRFPYAVFYEPDQDTVVVLAVLHQARDPDHWQSRL